MCLVSVVTGFQVSLFARTKPEINMAKSRESRNRELTRGYGQYMDSMDSEYQTENIKQKTEQTENRALALKSKENTAEGTMQLKDTC